MRQKSNSTPASSETLVRNIRRATRKHHAALTMAKHRARGVAPIGMNLGGARRVN
jgi:hypothetical protein